MTDAALHQGWARRHPHRRFVAVAEPADARDVADAVSGQVVAGKHGDDAQHGSCRAGVDRADPGMGVRRAQHRGIGLARLRNIVEIAAVASNKAAIFDPPHRLADAELFHRDTPGCLSDRT